MAEAWQTLEEAALTLGISSRTLHRRLARGDFQTRMQNGRREVLVVINERDPSLDRLAAAAARGVARSQAAPMAEASDSSDVSDTPADEPAYSSDEYGTAIEGAADDVQQTMLALHEDRIRRTDLAIMAYQQSVNVAAADARRAVTGTRIAWSLAGCATVALFLGATWATHSVTKAQGQVSHLSDNVRQLTSQIDVKSREIKELREESQASKVAAARAEGQLSAARGQIDQLLEAQRAAEARLAALAAARTEVAVTASTQPIPSVSEATQASATTQPAPLAVGQ